MTQQQQQQQQPPFYHDLHSKYISTLPKILANPESYEGAMSSHLRLNGIYWAIAGFSLLHSPSDVKSLLKLSSDDDNNESDGDVSHIASFVMKCYNNKTGGFSGNIGHDTHLLYTLSAIQILAITDELYLLDQVGASNNETYKSKIIKYISSLQQDDGSFIGDISSMKEIDTRFSYCAVSSLSILDSLNDTTINIVTAGEYILSCQNDIFDGGFSVLPGGESHSGQIFCCIGALAILKQLHLLDIDLLCWWLSERQCDSGGLNGRPEKQADVCYSWWILSSLSILGRMDWISQDKLINFILKCQDDEDGGVADRPQK